MAARQTFRAGDLTCTLVADGQLPYPPAILLANAQPDALERALRGEIDTDVMIVGRFSPLLVRGPRELVLVDTGFGPFAPGPGVGRLHESLRVEGVAATAWTSLW